MELFLSVPAGLEVRFREGGESRGAVMACFCVAHSLLSNVLMCTGNLQARRILNIPYGKGNYLSYLPSSSPS